MQWNQGLNARRTKQLLQVSIVACALRLHALLEMTNDHVCLAGACMKQACWTTGQSWSLCIAACQQRPYKCLASSLQRPQVRSRHSFSSGAAMSGLLKLVWSSLTSTTLGDSFNAPLRFHPETSRHCQAHITWAAGVSLQRVEGWPLPLPGGPPASGWHSCCPQQQCQYASHPSGRDTSCPGFAGPSSRNWRASCQGSAGPSASRGAGSACRRCCSAACI